MSIYEDLVFPAKQGMPFVAVNMVATVDGKAAPPGPGFKLFAAPPDWDAMVDLRAAGDAVLNGAVTATRLRPGQFLSDDLQARRLRKGKSEPVRCVVLSGGRSLDPGAPIFSSPERMRPIVYLPAAALRRLEPAFAGLCDMRPAGETSLEPAAALSDLCEVFGVNVVICEGGPHTVGTLLSHGLVDELFLTMAPKIFGGSAPLTIVEGESFPGERVGLSLISATPQGNVVFMRYRVEYSPSSVG